MINIVFEGSNADKYFETIYEGFLVGGSIEQTKGMTALRREIHILDKLESISEVYPCGKLLPVNEEPCRKLKSEKEELTFEKPELELVSRYMGLVPWRSGKSVRTALEVIDWLEAAIRDSGK